MMKTQGARKRVLGAQRRWGVTVGQTTTFGTLLRQYRLHAGLSQEALAARAGLSASAIAALERGRRNTPYPETLALLAEALGLAPAERAALAGASRQAPGEGAQRLVPAVPSSAAPALVIAPLPVPPTALIGREQAEAAVAHLLRPGAARLVTLTGPGGVGKSRLALAVAIALRDAYPDGVAFVDLAPIRDAILVPATIARALGLDGIVGATIQLLAERLRVERLLLMLDNIEQVVDAAPLLAELVAACPHLAILATSRIALRVRAEQLFSVPPLDMPPADRPLEETLGNTSVRLFVARARAVRPDFQLDADNARAVAEICRRVDGLPLAIELAAARVGLLPPPALLHRLTRRLTALTAGARDLPDRQRTLRAAIDWSYDLLPEMERTLFRRLAVFAGGCAHDAVAEICTRGLPLDPLDGVAALVEQSLLRQEDNAGEPRIGMLETIREYAWERLVGEGEEDATRRAHALHYLAFAEAAEPALHTPTADVWLARLEREHGNLRAALDWAWERGELTLALRLAGALWWFWHIHGHLVEGRGWLERLLTADAAGPSSTPAAVRAKALMGAGWLAHYQYDFTRAAELFAEGTAAQPDQAGDMSAPARAITDAMKARANGQYARARALLEGCVERLRAVGDRGSLAHGGLGLALARLGMVACEQGDDACAAALWEECLSLHRALGDREGVAVTLLGLADVARDRGDAARVRALCDEALPIFHALGARWAIGFALNNLALADYQEGDVEAATARAAESVALFRDLRSGSGLAEALTTQGYARGAQGDMEGARAALSESLQLACAEGPRWLVATNLEGLALLEAGQGQAERAALLLGAAGRLRVVIGAPLPSCWRADYERAIARVRARLSTAAFEAAWADGEGASLERIIADRLD